jgi:hypothetical protein
LESALAIIEDEGIAATTISGFVLLEMLASIRSQSNGIPRAKRRL